MNKAILALILLSVSSLLVAVAHCQMGVGIDYPGRQNYLDESEVDTAMGLAFSAELLGEFDPQVLIGLGIELQMERSIDEMRLEDARFSFIPFYLSGKFALLRNGVLKPELLMHFGYNLLNGNHEFKDKHMLDGGLYYALGAGLVHQSGMTMDIMYRVFHGNGSIHYNDMHTDEDIKQRNFTYRIGYRF